ncbi:MAG: alpha/beta fold hydrolase [Gemmatimonadota bacterium]|nr:alpha/beta fold hydrolase [Gemmatimonadota bacterium]
MTRPRSLATLSPLLIGFAACSSDRPDAVTALATRPGPCPGHEIEGDVTCYRVTVPENPAESDGRPIDLEVMVLEARADAGRADPLVVIPGGPGQSATRARGARSYFASVFDPIRDERDVVLLAPRGTAGSGELALDPSPDRLFDDLATVLPASWARDAGERLERDADLTRYTTSHIVEDLEATREALGYGPINIYATSYGTRVAQLYAARYPDRVRTLILKAPVPPSVIVPLTYTTGSQRALDAIFDLCRRQEPCRESYPEIESRFEALMERLRGDPAPVTVTNPLSGDETEVRVDDTAFGYVLRNLLMSASGGSAVLRLIDEAFRGDFTLLATVLPALRSAYATQLAGGMTLSVIASEDAPRVDEDDLERDAEAGFLRGAVARGMMAATADWPAAEVPPDLYEPLEGDIPTLLVTGAFDPATPPAFAEEIAGHLSNAEVVLFPGGAHSANNFDGLGGIMEAFVEAGSLDGLDLSAARENRPLPLVPGS